MVCQAFDHISWYKLFMDNEFFKRLKELRLEKGATQKQICDYLGLSKNAYGNYEQGIREPSLEILCRLCDFFEISADYLLGRTEY